jgi:RNA polymerase sigma-70 factor (ECF subfamily)
MQENNVLNQVDHEALYNEFFTPLFRYLFFRVKDYDVASDLTQTSFLKFINQKLNKIDRDYAIKLLFIIARNTLIDYWRTEKNRPHIPIEDINDVESQYKNPEENAISKEDTDFVRRILDDLDYTEREVISLRMSGDVSYEVIASTLNLSVVNARKIYSRGIQKVGVLLKDNNNF